MSREEELLQAYIYGTDVSQFKCRSRVETLLKKMCCGESCDDFVPRSRIEYLLKELSKKSGGSSGSSSSGGGSKNESITITKNGTYTAPNGVGYSPVNVNVPIPEGYVKPSGTKEITTNGTYDVTDKAEVVVDVPEREIILQDKEITENGVYEADSAYDGLGKITVDVPIPDGYVKPTTTKGETTYIPNTNDQTISSGTYLIGTQTIKGDGNLVADNIKSGVSIFGVNGTYEGSGGGTSEDMLQTKVDSTNSCKYLFYNYEGNNVDYISNLDTSNVTNMKYMFQYCSKLTAIPQLDTSNVTDMGSMFSNCENLTTIPLLNTSNVTNMDSTFYRCINLTTVPLFNTSNVTNMGNMFYGCTKLTTIPLLNTNNVTAMNKMFTYCENLTTIPQLNTSKVTNMSNMFQYCSKLKSILMYGMKTSFNISASTQFEREDLVTILNNLGKPTSSQTLTMGSTNLAKLTDEDKAIATGKGWTLA